MADSMLLTRYGLREWLTATVVAAVLAGVCVWLGWWWAAAVVAVVWLAVAMFFRDPVRRVPRDLPAEALLSPADGRVTAVETVDHSEVTGGPALVVRIFLSVLNVHVNRAPGDGRVAAVVYTPGRFHDARSHECPRENENNLVTVELDAGPTIGVRQIAGKLARRIVCPLRPGDRMRRGDRYGMIKFGSGAELVLPRERVGRVHVAVGDRVRGGLTTLVTLAPPTRSAPAGPAARRTVQPARTPP